jgi:flagellar motor protein MotB
MRALVLLLLSVLVIGCVSDDSGDAIGSRLHLTRVTFERNSALGYREHVEAAHRFARQVALLRGENRTRPVMIECHTDPKGSPQFHQGLGLRRARTMRDILVNAGVDTARIRTTSMGATKIGQPAGARTVSAREGDAPLTHNRYCDMFVI